MTTDRDFNLEERHGETVRRAYAGVTLTPEQRRRHRMLLAGAARRRGTDRFRFHADEIGVIAALALLAILAVFVWQSPGSGSNDEGDTANVPAATDAEATGTMLLDPTPLWALPAEPHPVPTTSSRSLAAGNEGHLAIYDRKSLEMIDSLELLADATPVNHGLAVSPDGSRLYPGSHRQTMRCTSGRFASSTPRPGTKLSGSISALTRLAAGWRLARPGISTPSSG